MSSPPEPEFYYSPSGKDVVGPVSVDSLLELRSNDHINDETLITAGGMQYWMPLSELLNSELFKKSRKSGEVLPDVSTPIRNPTLVLGLLATLFTNPLTIGLAAIGIPAYYLTRTKKRPAESIISAMKVTEDREREFFEGKLFPESGTTGLKAVKNFAKNLVVGFKEVRLQIAEKERVRLLKRARQEEAMRKMTQFPPQYLSSWIFYSLILFVIIIVLFLGYLNL